MPKTKSQFNLVEYLRDKGLLFNKKKFNFKERLNNIPYHGPYPTFCLDLVFDTLMVKPMMLNKFAGHTLDESTIPTLGVVEGKGFKKNPFNNGPILSTEENIERKEKIETFIAGLEKIAELEKKIASLEKTLIELESTLSQGFDLTEDQVNNIISEQKQPLLTDLILNKLNLIDLLKYFITTIACEINKDEDRQASEKEKEITEVLGEKKSRIIILEEALSSHQEELTILEKNARNNFLLNINQSMMGKLQKQHVGLLFYSPYNYNNKNNKKNTDDNENNNKKRFSLRMSNEID